MKVYLGKESVNLIGSISLKSTRDGHVGFRVPKIKDRRAIQELFQTKKPAGSRDEQPIRFSNEEFVVQAWVDKLRFLT